MLRHVFPSETNVPLKGDVSTYTAVDGSVKPEPESVRVSDDIRA
jgi:hypothetical protein